MAATVLTLIIGIVLIVIGISNTRGNISSLHSYHRNRVAEEDKIPFGRLVGLGTIVIGIGIIIFSALTAIAIYTDVGYLSTIGTAIMIASIVAGTALSFYAMKKYNGGIF